MKEGFWGILIVVLGLFGIVAVNMFQVVTVDNDKVYYVLKESTEGAMTDSIDFSYFRLTGDLKIVSEKFLESFARRYATNIVTYGSYTVYVHELNNVPPFVSVTINSTLFNVPQLGNNSNIDLKNSIDAVLETKYALNEVIDFLGITEDEWEKIINSTVISYVGDGSSGVDGNATCNSSLDNDDDECITGDIQFEKWEEMNLPEKVCYNDEIEKRDRKAFYKVCKCGKWSDEQYREISSNIEFDSDLDVYTYTWNLEIVGELNTITQITKETIKRELCAGESSNPDVPIKKGLEIMVPGDWQFTVYNDPKIKKPTVNDTGYIVCPKDGITIPVGSIMFLLPKYIPAKSSVKDRYVEWSSSDDSKLSITSYKPSSDCSVNANGTNCLHPAKIMANEIGEFIISAYRKNVPDTNASCKIKVVDEPQSVKCESFVMNKNSKHIVQTTIVPANYSIDNIEYSIDNTNLATIDKKSGIITGNNVGTGNVNITVTYTTKSNKKISGSCVGTLTDIKATGASCTAFNVSLTSSEFKNNTKNKKNQKINSKLEPEGSMCESVKYSITGGNGKDYVSIDEDTGAVTIEKRPSNNSSKTISFAVTHICDGKEIIATCNGKVSGTDTPNISTSIPGGGSCNFSITEPDKIKYCIQREKCITKYQCTTGQHLGNIVDNPNKCEGGSKVYSHESGPSCECKSYSYIYETHNYGGTNEIHVFPSSACNNHVRTVRYSRYCRATLVYNISTPTRIYDYYMGGGQYQEYC